MKKKYLNFIGSVLIITTCSISTISCKNAENKNDDDSSNEEIKTEKQVEVKPCISCSKAIKSVENWAMMQLAQGINMSYATTEWRCADASENGCTVNAIFYAGSEQINRSFFVDCNGNTN
jgi:hypothetical protein